MNMIVSEESYGIFAIHAFVKFAFLIVLRTRAIKDGGNTILGTFLETISLIHTPFFRQNTLQEDSQSCDMSY